MNLKIYKIGLKLREILNMSGNQTKIFLLLALTFRFYYSFGQQLSDSSKNLLQKKLIETHTSSCLILKDGKPVFSYGTITTDYLVFSIAKSITSLAIGCLIDDGKLSGTEERVSKFFPEWNQGLKSLISVKDLLLHTSGLEDYNTTGADLEHFSNFNSCLLQYALVTNVIDTPGTKPRYNNNALMLLSGIVEKASGKTLADYTREKIFEPLGIKNYKWTSDNDGHTLAASELYLSVEDISKIGLMIMQYGQYNRKQVLSEKWIRESVYDQKEILFKGFGTYGYLWWQITKSHSDNTMTGVSAKGWLGQFLTVYPGKKIVAVRLINEKDFTTDKYRRDGDAFNDFEKIVYDLQFNQGDF